ncbi:flagellar hook protein FlgE [Butyrivibrio sp. CB08]|uniref:flagellar hook protein FlgE n=1 Tax=Butyrivibrio sp. CB08 TaxID=2364879 RepID=UPI0013140321|nr:flagellar hook-basal body complex protein [Butyrivibrio sp. CB08]
MMRSLWSGVAGLKTHQLEMDVIGNNIANVNTTSYKSQATGFQDILYQTVKSGTGAGENVGSTNIAQVGLGSKVGSIYTNIAAQGSAVTTDNVLDLMITGDSFFIISPDISGAEMNFTRDGSFAIDANGDLVTKGNGYYVLGVMGEAAIGNAVQKLHVINRTPVTGPDGETRMVDVMPGQATSQSYFKGNIDELDESLEEGKALSIEVYGSDGEKYTLKFSLTDGGDTENNTYTLKLNEVVNEDGDSVMNPTDDVKVDLVYSKSDGKLVSANGNTAGTYTLNLTGDASVVNGLNIDFIHTTNYAGNSASHSSSIYGYRGDTKGLNQGYPNGELTNISFGTDGSIYGRYSNGQTLKKGQIAVAEFSNAMGLEKVGDNLYAASLNSGVAQIMDITKDGGYMNSGVLEGSNIDLAKEFTDMITTQRGFQANSKVITTSDEMLQILRGLKQ